MCLFKQNINERKFIKNKGDNKYVKKKLMYGKKSCSSKIKIES